MIFPSMQCGTHPSSILLSDVQSRGQATESLWVFIFHAGTEEDILLEKNQIIGSIVEFNIWVQKAYFLRWSARELPLVWANMSKSSRGLRADSVLRVPVTLSDSKSTNDNHKVNE